MSFRLNSLMSFTAVLVPLIGTVVPPAGAANSDVLSVADSDPGRKLSTAVLSAFQRREQKVRSFRFEWTEKVTPGTPPPTPPASGTLSPGKAAFESLRRRIQSTLLLPKEVVLLVDEDRVRFEERGPQAGEVPGTRVPTERLAVFDGTTGTDFVPSSVAPYGIASIVDSDSTGALEYVGSQPIVFTYRGTDTVKPPLKRPRRGMSPWKRGVIGGKECVILTMPRRSGHAGAETCLWLDPSSDFCIVRIEEKLAGALLSKTDISFEEDGISGSIPIQWKSSYWNGAGGLIRHVEYVVTKHEINPIVPDSAFRLDFTVGTLVTDRRAGEASYILLADGQKKLLRDADLQRGATYDELLMTREPRGGRPWLLVGAACTVLLLAFVAVRGVCFVRDRAF